MKPVKPRSIRLGEKELKSILMADPKSLRENPPLSRGGIHNILWQFTPIGKEGWTIWVTSNHTKENIVKWILTKGFLKDINKTEELLLTLLVSDDDFLSELFKQLKELNEFGSLAKNLYLTWLETKFSTVFKDSLRYLNSYTPKINVFKVWTLKLRLPPVLYIGIGYKDKGSLSSVPAWQEQMLNDGDGIRPIDILRALFSSFLFEIMFYGVSKIKSLPIGVLPSGGSISG
jgi:hypothetical protein